MREPFDVIIVGGGPAGLATAIFLLHTDPRTRGRVLVLEKERYPRDKLCAGGIGARADRLLLTAGATVGVPSVSIDGISLRLPQGTISARQRAIGRVVRRLEYDHALAKIAEQRGVLVRDGERATAIALDDRGVTLETSAGTYRGRVLVGADGVGSFVRRSMGLSVGTLRAQVIELDTEQVAGDPERDLLHFDASDGNFTGYAWDFPTVVDGEPLVCRGVYHLKLDGANDDIRARLAARLAERGLDIDRYRLKRFAERGFELHAPFAAPRVVLVGEAAGIDGLTGEGIAQAIAYGAFAGPYLAEKLQSGDLAFHDFTARLARSPVGLELGVRARILPFFFGKNRAKIERFVFRTPDFVALGAQHFAGSPLSRAKLARTAWLAAWHAVREAV